MPDTLFGISISVCDGITPVTAEVFAGDFHAWRRLAALVFCDIEKVLYSGNNF